VVSAVGIGWRVVQNVTDRNLAALLDLKQVALCRENIFYQTLNAPMLLATIKFGLCIK
jgi:hypothetical protein